MVVTENRLRKMGFVEKDFLYDQNPKKIWVLGNHMTDSGSFADTIIYDPEKERVSANYGGNVSIPIYASIDSTWELKQFLAEHPHDDEEAIHEEKFGIKDDEWKVILVQHGDYKIKVMKELKEMFNLTLRDTKEIVNNLPQKISTEYFKDSAEVIKEQLESIGAEVVIQ